MNSRGNPTTSRLVLAMMRNVRAPQKQDQGAARAEWYRRANAIPPGAAEYATLGHVAVLSDG